MRGAWCWVQGCCGLQMLHRVVGVVVGGSKLRGGRRLCSRGGGEAARQLGSGVDTAQHKEHEDTGTGVCAQADGHGGVCARADGTWEPRGVARRLLLDQLSEKESQMMRFRMLNPIGPGHGIEIDGVQY